MKNPKKAYKFQNMGNSANQWRCLCYRSFAHFSLQRREMANDKPVLEYKHSISWNSSQSSILVSFIEIYADFQHILQFTIISPSFYSPFDTKAPICILFVRMNISSATNRYVLEQTKYISQIDKLKPELISTKFE